MIFNSKTSLSGWLVIVIISLSCNTSPGTNAKGSKTARADSTTMPIDVTHASVELQDLKKFTEREELLNYYNPKMDSVEQLLIDARKTWEAGGNITLDSVDRAEFKYRNVFNARNKALYMILLDHKKDENAMTTLFWITKTRSTSALTVDSIFKTFPANLQNSRMGQEVNRDLKIRLVQAVQETFDPSLLSAKFTTSEGHSFSLNEIKSKYILLDFWSSWCAPCRFENRAMIKNKDLLLKKGNLTIVAVSLDTNREKWLKACNIDQLTYQSVCDFKEMKSPIVQAFNVQKIPHNVIITQDGQIVKREVWGDELVKFVATLQ